MKTMNNLVCLSLAFLSITQPLINVVVAAPLPPRANVDVPLPTPASVAQASSTYRLGDRTPTWGPPADIVAACAMAKDKAFCVSSLTGSPQSKGLDLNHLAFLALQMALNKGTEVYKSVEQKLQKEGALSKALNGALNDCSDQYSNALGHINDCVNGLATANTPYNDMRTWLSGAMTSAEVCQRGIVEAKLPNNNGGDIANNDFAKLCDNAISIITIMQTDALKAGQTKTLS